MAVDLSARAIDERELMDDPAADPAALARTYRRFGAVNAVVSRPGALYRGVILPRARAGRVRILDVGAGGGDLCRAIAVRLTRDRLAGEITALDADERATAWASAHDGGAGVTYRCARASDLVRIGEVYDIVLSNHVLHHLTAQELQELLADSVRLTDGAGVVVHRDIARSRAAYVLFATGTWPFSRNALAGSFIRPDGLTSIRRSYTPSELASIAPAGWTVRRGMPARLELRWERGVDRR